MSMRLMTGCVRGLCLSALLLGGCELDIEIPIDEFWQNDASTEGDDTGVEAPDGDVGATDFEPEESGQEEEFPSQPVLPPVEPSPAAEDVVCEGKYLTRDECLWANGTIDYGAEDSGDCVEDERLYCCLPDALTNPCPGACAAPYECVGWQNDPSNAGGAFLPDHQCPHWTDVCCEDSTIPAEDLTGETFTPKSCPIDENVYQPTAKEQPNYEAAMMCMEYLYLKDGDAAPWYCPQKLYEEIAADLELLEQEYPVVFEHAIQMYDAYANMLMCVAMTDCVDFPKGHFDDLGACFGEIEENCLFESDGRCGQSHLYFDVPFNVWRALPYFDSHAQTASTNSVCEPDSLIGLTGRLPGYHLEEVDEEWGIRIYKLTATSQHTLGAAACEVIIEAAVIGGVVTELNRQDLSDASCQVPGF